MTDHSATDDELRAEVEELREEKTAIPLELFFDLVFVFAITQVVSLILDGDLAASAVAEGAVVLALLWWVWGNWTWTTNGVDLDPRLTRAMILVAMIGIFIMAQAVPFAFGEGAVWLAWAYAFVRAMALTVGAWGARGNPVAIEGWKSYAPFSSVAPAIVIVGAYVGGDAQIWFWLVAIVIEVISAFLAGRADWDVDAGHFAERHGLILIIALGESIIAVGVSLEEVTPSWDLALLLAIGLAGASALWWVYFDRLQDAWEHALRDADLHRTAGIARDVYSLLHYPMMLGIVLYAVALEEAFHHPDDHLESAVQALFVGGFALFLLGTAAATYRARRYIMGERMLCVALIAAITYGWTSASARTIVVVSTIVLLAAVSAEYFRFTRIVLPRLQAGDETALAR